jgi:hypothetical protein
LVIASCVVGGFGERANAQEGPATAKSAIDRSPISTSASMEEKQAATARLAKKKSKGFITVATLGSVPLTVSGKKKPQAIVDQMISHWRGRFSQVLPDDPDLIVVPEACDRPRGLSAEQLDQYYRVRGNQIRDFFARVAKENHCYIVYAAKRTASDGTFRNSSVMIDRDGNIAGTYNKNHPTIGEIDQGIVCGHEAPVIECDFGRVAMAICFDLNFDELRLQYAAEKPDLIVFSSMYHGGLMQQYWAYSCRCHFVGAIAGRATPSEIRDPLGDVVASTTNYFDFAVATINLDSALVHLDENWGRLKAMKAKYGTKVKITDPGELGAVLIASEHETVSIDAMIAEFELERLDDYLARSRARRNRGRFPQKN